MEREALFSSNSSNSLLNFHLKTEDTILFILILKKDFKIKEVYYENGVLARH